MYASQSHHINNPSINCIGQPKKYGVKQFVKEHHVLRGMEGRGDGPEHDGLADDGLHGFRAEKEHGDSELKRTNKSKEAIQQQSMPCRMVLSKPES